ncbi:cryptochrome/photolyase family protein [Idiomarina seosinensis]|uniref:cryptochrome/photolyase family protein n=1 Tax=Idiomarina seosinensis TaxID=281739 RepID=UPI00384CAA90
MKKTEVTKIRLILGDQLNASHSWYQQDGDDTLYVMMEVMQEATYVRHHRQKILALFAAMRRFATALEKKGLRVCYLTLDDEENRQSVTDNLSWLLKQYPEARLQCQLPDEYRLDHALRSWAGARDIVIDWCDSEHFLTPRDSIKQIFGNNKSLLMETFYRHQRRQFNLLMEDGKPVGGRWNFDGNNRKKIPASENLPQPLTFGNDVTAIDEMLTQAGVETLGTVDATKLLWPTSRQQARQLLDYFCDHLLVKFGTYQDTMTTEDEHQHAWSLYHCRLSFALNSKILSPLEVVSRAIETWRQRPGEITLNQIEGFVRQIIGWREYIRAIYWHHMPAYKTLNQLEHDRPLPRYYWDADTKMNCIKHSVQQSLDFAYAHHIQRLMITGNFALLAGVDPDALDEWYLGIYIDAFEWVELPNTRGMSQYADGGLLATKPYVSSANYIQKMGHYCKNCYYRHNQKTGERACPFNSLYWHFIDRHEQRFKDNHRMNMMYSVWNKKSQEERQQILQQANDYLKRVNDL